ncbi:putative NAD-dependent oxidoreductase [Sideroxyarcus emersonii]|uniref:NAD-dependent oxidoreductase n=1 Tax=Sideroxyarcus emersonii TaxID=2764705 RepID=A0AAN2BZ46_9PROT|nr:NAD(P)-dependent oxidoreductase [Sideroxyarcus emersonii]BCK87834.1 putative NAD-dependent oxidoreductase [Sideroxyarcus emersonii]
MTGLGGKVIFITGSSRGIGREIALRCARDGAKVVITGKTAEAHPKLPGTIHSVAAEVEAAGGQALAIQLDVRDEQAIQAAVAQAAAHFGGIDVLVNNASAISLTPTLQTPAKRLDLMWDVNMRATFLVSQACIPYLKKAANPHILTLSPPLNLEAKWFAPHVAYSISKYGMSLCALGMAKEFAQDGIAVNCLWPRTTIATAAIEFNFPEAILRASRKPAIVADAAHAILRRDSKTFSGLFFLDEEVLRAEGVKNFDHYAVSPGERPYDDLFL